MSAPSLKSSVVNFTGFPKHLRLSLQQCDQHIKFTRAEQDNLKAKHSQLLTRLSAIKDKAQERRKELNNLDDIEARLLELSDILDKATCERDELLQRAKQLALNNPLGLEEPLQSDLLTQ